MRSVENHLVACVSVDCAHDAALDRSKLIEGVGHRSEAVGCAGSGGNDGVFLCQGVFVYAVNNRLKVVAGRSGDDNLLGACVYMSLALRLGAVEACAFENNVDAELAPGKLSGVRLGINRNFFSVYDNGVFFCLYRLVVTALGGVVL